MSFILNIDTTTNVCSVALSQNGKLVDFKETADDRNHSQVLTVFIEQIFKENKITAKDLSAAAISEGPGSYTGLRIGTSVAKGICYANEIPLIAIDTLQSIAVGAKNKVNDNKILFCPMIDARRMEVYFSIFDNNLKKLSETESLVIDENSFSDKLQKNKIIFCGNGSQKCKELITSDNAVFVDNIITSAKNMIELSYKKFTNKNFVDVAYFTPFYLKSFIAIKSKKNLLGL